MTFKLVPIIIPLEVIQETCSVFYIIYLCFDFQSLVVFNNTELLKYSIKMTIYKKLEAIRVTLEYHWSTISYNWYIIHWFQTMNYIKSHLWLITYDIVSDFSDPKANIVLMNQIYNWKSNIKCSCNLQIPHNSRTFIDIT